MTIDTNAMPIYQGTKTLKAHPMTRGEYNAYRGWHAPVDEDMGERGYLVEYTDGGKANDSRHQGYISWSPADVFEKTYRPAGTFQDRVRIELAELDEKHMKLAGWLGTPAAAAINPAELQRLRDQLDAMRDYSTILKERIDAFSAPAAEAIEQHDDPL